MLSAAAATIYILVGADCFTRLPIWDGYGNGEVPAVRAVLGALEPLESLTRQECVTAFGCKESRIRHQALLI